MIQLILIKVTVMITVLWILLTIVPQSL